MFLILRFHTLERNSEIWIGWRVIITPLPHVLLLFLPVIWRGHCFFQMSRHFFRGRASSLKQRLQMCVCWEVCVVLSKLQRGKQSGTTEIILPMVPGAPCWEHSKDGKRASWGPKSDWLEVAAWSLCCKVIWWFCCVFHSHPKRK